MRRIQNTTEPGNDNYTSGVTTQAPPAVFRCSSPSLLVTDQARALQPSHEFANSCLNSFNEEDELSEKLLEKMEEDEPSIDSNDNYTSGVTTQEPPAVFRCSSPSLLVTDQARALQPSHEFANSCLNSFNEEDELSEKLLEKMEEDEPSIDSIEEAVNLDTLPPEVLVHIQSYLDPRSNNELRRVCRSLRNAADPKFAATLRRERKNAAILRFEERKKGTTIKLKELRSFGAQFSSPIEFTLDFSDLPLLFSHDLSDRGISDQELQSIVERFPNITRIKGMGEEILSKKCLFLHLSKLEHLTSLNVDCLRIGDNDLVDLGRLQHLTSLDLHGVFFDSRLAHLSNLHNLSSLRLDVNGITNDHLVDLCQLNNLVSLHLADMCARITNDGLIHLSNLSNLRSLKLDIAITNDGLIYLSDLQNLAHLDLSWCSKITNDGLAHLSRFQNLTHLALNDKITNDGLAHLSDLQNIASLDLTHCLEITDDGLAHLSRLQNLTSLALPYAITDAGLVHLRNLQNLANLDLRECYLTTDHGINLLKQRLKSLQIIRSCRAGLR